MLVLTGVDVPGLQATGPGEGAPRIEPGGGEGAEVHLEHQRQRPVPLPHRLLDPGGEGGGAAQLADDRVARTRGHQVDAGPQEGAGELRLGGVEVPREHCLEGRDVVDDHVGNLAAGRLMQ